MGKKYSTKGGKVEGYNYSWKRDLSGQGEEKTSTLKAGKKISPEKNLAICRQLGKNAASEGNRGKFWGKLAVRRRSRKIGSKRSKRSENEIQGAKRRKKNGGQRRFKQESRKGKDEPTEEGGKGSLAKRKPR